MDTSVRTGHFTSVLLQMSPNRKLRPDAALAQAKKLLPVEIRDTYCSLQQTQMPDL
jgi:hypothetical protein